jgi:hypothetical protein
MWACTRTSAFITSLNRSTTSVLFCCGYVYSNSLALQCYVKLNRAHMQGTSTYVHEKR